jgi:hypothetical protein
MQLLPEEPEIEFDYQLDPSKPLVLLLGWIDHEGIVSSLKTSGCWFIFKTEPFPPSFTTEFEPRSTYPANFLGRVCRSDQRGNT